jgi:alanine racemase
MDNLTVDLGGGSDAYASRGAEAVLIGARGGQRITAEELARRMHTINYEVTCALTARVPRIYHRDGDPLGEHWAGSLDSMPLPPASVRPR